MTPTASGLDEARERLTLIAGRTHSDTVITMPLGLPPVAIADLRALLASEAVLREELRNIQTEAHRPAGNSVHLKRVVALQCRAARLSQDGGAK